MNFNKQKKQFIDFIESYSSYKYSAQHIAKNNDDETILNVKKIGSHHKFFSLDNICKTRSIFYNELSNIYPKTTDALAYNEIGDNFFIYLIEFKGDKIENRSTKYRFKEYLKELKEKKNEAWNDIEKREIEDIINRITPFYNKYSDSLLNSLILKPLETITTSLPLIYEDYFIKNQDDADVKRIDIKEFIRNAKVVYLLVSLPQDEDYDENYDSPFRERANLNCESDLIIEEEVDLELTENYKTNLDSFYKRYEKVNIFDSYDYLDTRRFNTFVKETFGP